MFTLSELIFPSEVWTLTVVMVAVFIYELVLNAKNQGSPFSFKVSQTSNSTPKIEY